MQAEPQVVVSEEGFMRLVKRPILAGLLLIFSFVTGCQIVPEKSRIGTEEKTHVESLKDAAISNAVKEKFLSDKAVDLTRINVQTTEGAVDLTGTVTSLEAREHAVKLAWQVTGVQSVVNHLQIEK
jgi:hyperosmotically inducible periplasmic protein